MSGSYIFEKLLDTFRGQQDRINERVWSQGNALSTWLILGNAGALVLALNAHIGGKFCDADVLRFSAFCFAGGLVLTFAGLAFGYAGSLWASIKLANIGGEVQGAWIAQTFIDGLEEGGIDVPDDAPLNVTIRAHQAAIERGQRKLRYALVVAGIATLLVVGGAIFFSVGILRPLFIGNPFQACEVAEASLDTQGKGTVNVAN